MRRKLFVSLLIAVSVIAVLASGCSFTVSLDTGTASQGFLSPAPSYEVSPSPAASTDEPSEYTDEPLPDETPSPPPFSETEVLRTFKQDIDDDGKSETVSVARGEINEGWGGYMDVFIYVQDGSDTKEAYIDSAYDYESAFLTKTENGSSCLLLTLGYEDAEYITYVCSFNTSTAVLENTRGGKISAVKGTEVKIEDWGDALRSWDYYQKFKLNDDFSLSATTEKMIIMSEGVEPLHTIKKLPVQMLVDGVYKDSFVEADEYIIPLSFDFDSYLKFKLKDGSEGRILFTRDDSGDYIYGFLIDGFSEEEYFDNLEFWG